MPNQDLLKYIQDSIAQNIPKDEIKRAVLEVGWAEADVATAFFVAEGGVVPVAQPEPAPILQPEPAPIVQQIPQYSAPSFAQPATVSSQPINFASSMEPKSMPMATMPSQTPHMMPNPTPNSQPMSMAQPSAHHGTLLWVMGTIIVALLIAGGIAIWVVMNNKGEVVMQKAGVTDNRGEMTEMPSAYPLSAPVVVVPEESVRDRGNNAKTQSLLSTIRSAADIFYTRNRSYGSSGLTCTTAGSLFADTKISSISSFVNLSNYPVGTRLDCGNTATEFSVAGSLTSGYWCVDSTGVSRKTSAVGVGYTALAGSATAAHTTVGATVCN